MALPGNWSYDNEQHLFDIILAYSEQASNIPWKLVYAHFPGQSHNAIYSKFSRMQRNHTRWDLSKALKKK